MLKVKEIVNTLMGNKVVEATAEAPVQLAVYNKETAYNTVMEDTREIGFKKFASIPLELLEIDTDYQRLSVISKDKINALVREFNTNLCDPILVSPHPETHSFAVIDGSHRMVACELKGIKNITAVIAEGLPADPHERKIAEAVIFCEQAINIDHLSPAHKHRANVCRGIKKYVVLDECMKGRKLLLNIHELKNKPKEEQDRMRADGWRVLTGYNAALSVAARSDGKEFLTNVFDIIQKCNWHDATNGYGANVIRPVAGVLSIHDDDPIVMGAIIKFLSTMEPDGFFARAHAAYPERKEKERLTMYLEIETAKLLNREPLYTGGDMRKITTVINAQKYREKGDKVTQMPTGTDGSVSTPTKGN